MVNARRCTLATSLLRRPGHGMTMEIRKKSTGRACRLAGRTGYSTDSLTGCRVCRKLSHGRTTGGSGGRRQLRTLWLQHCYLYATQRLSPVHPPIFNYPYERSREALDQLYRHSELDPWEGIKLRYINPATGGYPMPTMATFMQFMPAGFQGRISRTTDSTIYSVVEGRGTACIGDQRLDFGPRDIFCRALLDATTTCRIERYRAVQLLRQAGSSRARSVA